MMNRANIYWNSRFSLPSEEIHKPAVPRYLGAASFAVRILRKGWIL